MQTSFPDSLTSVLQKGAIFSLSFADDAVLMSFGKLGISVPGLQDLSAILIAASVGFWSYRVLQFFAPPLLSTKPFCVAA